MVIFSTCPELLLLGRQIARDPNANASMALRATLVSDAAMPPHQQKDTLNCVFDSYDGEK
jgi:hypothetical protein